MRLGALISGGKDSLFAMYLMQSRGHEIKYLITMLPKRTDSYMFHHPNAHLTKLQAEAMEIPLISKETEGEKEEELEDLNEIILSIKDEIDGIVSGALASKYQKRRIDSICEEVGLSSLAPLWGKDGKELWEDLLKEGLEVIVTSVAAEGLDKGWLGKKVDSAALKNLMKLSEKYRFHLGFEGGEAETLVLDMPLFKRKIKINNAKKEWDGVRGTYIIEEACLENKNDADLIKKAVDKLDRKISNSINKATRNLEKFGILFSAGLDSSLIAKISEDEGKKAVLYSVGLKGSPDLKYVRIAKNTFKSPIKIKVITPEEVEEYARKVISVIKSYNPMDVSIGIPFYIACEMARGEGISHMLCGQGADELFGGYHRYLNMSKDDLQTALSEDIKKAYESALNRDQAIANANSLSLLTPFLDPELVKGAMNLPADLKIRYGIRKFILREVAKKRGLPDTAVNREKKAIQYSTGVDKVLRKIAKREKKDLRTYCKDVFLKS